jgi:hypothetical protein
MISGGTGRKARMVKNLCVLPFPPVLPFLSVLPIQP